MKCLIPGPIHTISPPHPKGYFILFSLTFKLDQEIVYTYDFGDHWEHDLTILGREDATRDFICLDGSGHYVAEDVGGVRGWESLKQAYQTTRPTKEQKERRKWFEQQASNSDPRGLAGNQVNAWDREATNRALKSDTMFERFDKMGEASSAFQAGMEAHLGRRKQ